MVDFGSVTTGFSVLREDAWVQINVDDIFKEVDCEQEYSFNDPPLRESAKERVLLYED